MTQDVNPTSKHLNLRITSDPSEIAEVRRAVESLAAAVGLDEQSIGEVGLCVNEALANVMRHAYGSAKDRPILVAAYCHDGALLVTIRDWGNGVNPASLPPKPYDPLEPGGLGLICLNRMMDRVSYVPQSDGMLLVMKKEKHNSDARRISECGHE